MQESTLHFFNPGARRSANRIGKQNRGPSRKRGLRFEPLEDRRMLSVLFVDDDAAGGGDGDAWSTAFNDLQPALEAAAAFNSDTVAENDISEIWIAEGTYRPSAKLEQDDARSVSFSLVDGVTLYGGFGGTETALSQRDLSQHETVLSGDIGVVDDFADNAYTVVYCGEEVVAAMDGMTVTRGNAEGDYSSDRRERRYGGGIYNVGELTAVNCQVLGNRGSSNGGVCNEAALTITNSVIAGNYGFYDTGGLLSTSSSSELHMANVTIAANEMYGGWCSGLGASGDFTIANSIISLNEGEEVVLSDWDSANIGTNLIGIDPGFVRNPSPGTDGVWGTPDDDYGNLRLTERSPAIGIGNTADLPLDITDSNGDGDTAEVVPVDLDGNERVFGGTVDIGAYEYQGTALPGRETPSLTVTTGDDEFDLYDGDITLREAIYYAGIVDMGTTITFDSSLEGGTILLDGDAIELRSSLTLDASALDAITVDAGGRSRVFNVGGYANNEVELIRLTVTGGVSDLGNGGGILNEAGSLTIKDCVIRDSESYWGGGIYSSGTLTLIDSLLTDNQGRGEGSGIYNTGRLTVSGSIISDNGSKWCDGGGIYSSGTLEVTDSTVSNNTAQTGGGIAGFGAMTITNSLISGNTTGGTFNSGGGIAIENGALTIIGSTISDNSAARRGGGIYAEDSEVSIDSTSLTGNSATSEGGGVYVEGPLSVTDSTVSENAAGNGGGLWCSGTLTLSDSTLSGNTIGDEGTYVSTGGGAVLAGGDVSIVNCQISNNRMLGHGGSGSGGGVRAGGTLSVLNSVFSSNSAKSTGGALYASGPVTIVGSEFVGNASASGAVSCGDLATVVSCFFGANTATSGGAINLHSDSTVVNSVFIGNGAVQYGGAFFGRGEWTIANSTFTQNTAGCGQGGIYTYGAANVTNSIFWQNDGGDLTGGGDFIVDSSLVGIDPQFRENPSDGGDGWGDDPDTPDVDESANDDYGDLRLTASSPAVNSGQSDLLAADVADLDGDGNTEEPVPFDMGGESRVWGDSPDAGAYEFQAEANPGREMPAVVVTTSDDVSDFYDGEISLREAIWHAGTDGLATRITFDSSLDGSTLVLGGTELLIDKTCTIDASSLDSLTIDADGRSRVFQVMNGENRTVSLVGLTITGGNRRDGGGLYNRGVDTTVANCTFFHNSARTGGGIYNNGTLAVLNSVFLANEAQTSGSAIVNYGELALTNDTFVQNHSSAGIGTVISGSDPALRINNSLFWQNEGGNVYGERVSLANTLLGVDPRFVAEPDPGLDQTWGTGDDDLGDLRLTDVSPAVDAGDSSLLPADRADIDGDGDTSEPIPLDRAGAARAEGNSVDIGAYEFGMIAATGRETPSVTVTTAEDVFDLYDNAISLREAIWYADGLGADTTIQFDSALDEATLLLEGSELAVQDGLTIDASDLTSLTVDAGHGSRAFANLPHDATLTLNGLTVIRGSDDYHGGAILSYGPLVLTNSVVARNFSGESGGAIYASASLSISNSTLSENDADYVGGAVWAAGPVTIADSTISDNNAKFDGGGIYSDGMLTIENSTLCGNSTDRGSGGAVQSTADLILLNSTLADNSADGNGGAIHASGNAEIRGSTLIRNAAGSGGGISFSGGLTIESSTVSENTSTNSGGGIYGDGVLTLTDSTVAENSSAHSGGGVYLYSGMAALTNNVFAGNTAEADGGGVYAHKPEVTMTNTILIANSARNGGGIYDGGNYNNDGSLTLANCTLTTNAATDSGGGVYVKEPTVVTIGNTIIAGNTAQINDPDISSHYSDDYTPSGSHNLIGNGDSQYVFTNGQNGNLVGTSETPIDPLFVRAPSDGGDGWGDNPDTVEIDESANDDYGDLRLAAGSPAIDHGSRGALPADEFDLDGDGDVAETIPVDLAGEGRIQSVAVDIGAYEYVVDPDLDNDGMVASAELDIVRGNWGTQVTPGDRMHGDFSGDGVVDSTDLSIVRMHYGPVAAASAADAVFAEADVSEADSDETVYGPLAESQLRQRTQDESRLPFRERVRLMWASELLSLSRGKHGA